MAPSAAHGVPTVPPEGKMLHAAAFNFGVTALLLTGAFVVLGLRFFRRDVLQRRPVLRSRSPR